MGKVKSQNQRSASWIRGLGLGQGIFYLVTGVWPIVSIRTFEAVTGPKTDHWLVKTVGALVAVMGGSLTVSSSRNGPSRDLAATAAGMAAALAAVDVIYVSKKRISRIYLLDAVAELAIVAGWIPFLKEDRSSNAPLDTGGKL